nr:putative reverse transcriptase domain-containing protein [Tanacetum cinerariifolium]
MVVYLSKSDASASFDQIVDFLNAHVIQYALMVNLTIYVSCIKQLWASATIKKVNDVVKLRALIDGKRVVVTEDVIQQDLRLDDADGVECLPSEEIFTKLTCMGYEKPPPKELRGTNSVVPWHLLLSALLQYIFDSMVKNVDSPSKFLMYPWFLQVIINAQVDELSSHNNQYTSSALTQNVFSNMRRVGKGFSGVETPLFAKMLLEQDKIAQVLEIFKLKKRVKKLEKKRRSKSSSLKRLRKVGTSQRVESTIETVMGTQEDVSKQEGKIDAIDADEDITLVDAKTQVDMDAELQGRIDDVSVAATKEVNVAEPIVFDDEEVTMTMAQALIKIKAKKTRLLDEQMAKRLHDEEVEQAAAKEKQIQEKYLENIRKYQSLKRKVIFIAQARKNMIIYLKNMAGYKMEHFKEKYYLLSNAVMIMMLSVKLQVEEESEMARGADKMYYDRYWWPGMKKDIALYEGIAMDFVTKLPRTSSRHDIIWVIMDRLTKSAHFLPMREDYKMDRLARLYLSKTVARHGVPKGVVRFGKKGKLAPRFIRPFEIIEKVGTVSYRLDLNEELNGVHDMLHVSNLKKFLADQTLQVPLDEIRVDDKLKFIEEPVKIIEREFKKLKRSRIAIVKVRWNSKHGSEFMWEREDQMKLNVCPLLRILYRVDDGESM